MGWGLYTTIGSEKLFQCDGTDIYYVTINVTMKKLIDVSKYVCFRQYMRGARCMTEIKLKDKVAIITGGSKGIGKWTSIDMAKRGGQTVQYIIFSIYNSTKH